MSPGKQGGRPDQQGDSDVAVESKPKQKAQKPKLYRVLLHNDDYTPMEFVVGVLREVFHKSESDAMAIMLHAHTRGYAVAGVFTHEIAEQKVAKVHALAEEAQFPLLCSMEPED
jgi:ATP-dependent Clp protease adaptor protein ClpS